MLITTTTHSFPRTHHPLPAADAGGLHDGADPRGDQVRPRGRVQPPRGDDGAHQQQRGHVRHRRHRDDVDGCPGLDLLGVRGGRGRRPRRHPQLRGRQRARRRPGDPQQLPHLPGPGVRARRQDEPPLRLAAGPRHRRRARRRPPRGRLRRRGRGRPRRGPERLRVRPGRRPLHPGGEADGGGPAQGAVHGRPAPLPCLLGRDRPPGVQPGRCDRLPRRHAHPVGGQAAGRRLRGAYRPTMHPSLLLLPLLPVPTPVAATRSSSPPPLLFPCLCTYLCRSSRASRTCWTRPA